MHEWCFILKAEYEKNGYYFVRDALGTESVESLISEMSIFDQEMNNYGVRNLLNKVSSIRSLATSSPLIDIAREILGRNAKPVRSVCFDKVPSANWNVAWHQDTSIALKEKFKVKGFGPWSEKQGVVHTEPPEEYLKNTLTLRLHLDKANSETGVLRILPASHIKGRIPSRDLIKEIERSESSIVECIAEPGDVLLMCPLLFHSSRKAKVPSHRRIIHIEYSAMKLPSPLEWYEVEEE